MIYAFEKGDKRREGFLQVLRESGIDYQISEHDTSVVRVLGNLTPDLQKRLNSAVNGSTSVTMVRPAEADCLDWFRHSAEPPVIAGPCAVESRTQIETIAEFLSQLGIKYLRGGAYKPRTSADSFQGLGRRALELLRECADRHSLYVVTEVMDQSQIEPVATYADILQVGSRNMYNYTLLTALGAVRKPVLLKRGMAATLSEWFASANYVKRGGNESIILCERGVRTFEPQIAHTLDLAAVVIAKQETDYPVIADTSHAAGRTDLVAPLALAAFAAGADGVMVEVHPEPKQALSDGKQALTFAQFEKLYADLSLLHAALKRR